MLYLPTALALGPGAENRNPSINLGVHYRLVFVIVLFLLNINEVVSI